MSAFKRLERVACASMLSIAGVVAQAADPATSDDWQFNAGLYLWGAGLNGETSAGSDFDISFGDLINNLNMAFMGNFEARKSKWSLAADVIYLNV